MTRHTVSQLRAWRKKSGGWLQIRAVGASPKRVQAWLGQDVPVQSQGPGDLGDRLLRAFQEGFAQGVERLVVVGIDCPELDEETIAQALQSLEAADLVLGPATDGGYYLIGLRAMAVKRFTPLFQGIDWGSDRVLSQTLERGQDLGLGVRQLSPLSDVDVPEELGVWQRARYQTQPMISVIIPVLNEAAEIGQTLEEVLTGENLEVIVVDGGSQDKTVEIVQGYGEALSTPLRLLSSPAGRALQCNVGLQAAQGEWVLLLHGDTRVPRGFDVLMREVLRDEGVVAGAFELAVASPAWTLRLVEWGVRWRSRWLQFPYGDQGLFISRQRLLQLGGVPDLPLMEDFELVRRLRHLGKVAIAPVAVVTSARRWERLGVLRVLLLNQLIILSYFLGISPKRLAQWYHRRRG